MGKLSKQELDELNRQKITLMKSLAALFDDDEENYLGDDYLSNKVWTYVEHGYTKCVKCKLYVYTTHVVARHCPICAMGLKQFEVSISFAASKSGSYKTALKYIRAFPRYVQEDDRHVVRFLNLSEFCEHRNMARALSSITSQWKSALCTFNDQKVSADAILALHNEIERMKNLANASHIAFDESGQAIYTLRPAAVSNAVYIGDYSGNSERVSL